MAKATAEITIYKSKSVSAVYRYYLLASTKPSKPTTYPPATTWVSTEPSYTENSMSFLYFVDCTVLTDGSFTYSDVSISSSYEAAKQAYNKASATASSLANWCHENNKSLINGSKIYTGTVTATQIASTTITAAEIASEAIIASKIRAGAITTDKINARAITADKIAVGTITAENIAAGAITADRLNVDSLQAISAQIGGFYIHNDALIAGTFSLTDQNHGVYLGTDGIRSVDEDGSVTIEGDVAKFDSLDGMSKVDIRADGISIHSITVDGGTSFQSIDFVNDGVEGMFITHDGIRHTQSDAGDIPIVGFSDSPNITELGQNTRIHGNLYMNDQGYIGTNAYPTGSHVLGNDKYIYCLNSSKVSARVIGMSTSDNIIIGATAGTNGSIFSYINAGKNFSVNENSTFVFGTTMDGEERVFRSVPTYNRTTTSGTAVRVASNGELSRYTSSSMRYKEDITLKLDDSLNPERLYDLGVYQYKYRDGHISKNDQRYGMNHIGFLAEDVKHKYPIAANYNEDGEVEDWSERYIIPAMLKLIQKQNQEIQNLKVILKGENT